MPNIYEAMIKLGVLVGPIAKERHQPTDGGQGVKYAFRGIDQVMDAFSPAMAELGIQMEPSYELIGFQPIGKTGGTSIMATVKGTFTFTLASDPAQKLVAQTIGSAGDTYDKATNKAMATSLKYALLQTCMIPLAEGDMDSVDSDTAANAGGDQRGAQQSTQRREAGPATSSTPPPGRGGRGAAASAPASDSQVNAIWTTGRIGLKWNDNDILAECEEALQRPLPENLVAPTEQEVAAMGPIAGITGDEARILIKHLNDKKGK